MLPPPPPYKKLMPPPPPSPSPIKKLTNVENTFRVFHGQADIARIKKIGLGQKSKKREYCHFQQQKKTLAAA